MNLIVDQNGNLQAPDINGPLTREQQAVVDAIADPGVITLNFVSNVDNVTYGATDDKGYHTIDLGDTALLVTPYNRSRFTPGVAVLHEVVEGLGEVNPALRGKLTAHDWAHQWAPGLKELGMTINSSDSRGFVIQGTLKHMVMDGTGTILRTLVHFDPPIPPGQLKSWSKATVMSVRSEP